MIRYLNTVLLGLCLVLFLVSIGFCERAAWLGATPRFKTVGFSAYGLQCGTSYNSLLNRIDPSWRTDVVTPKKSYAVQDKNGRHLNLFLGSRAEQPIEVISIFPVTESLSIELDGQQFVFHDDSLERIEDRIGERAVKLEGDRFQFRRGSQLLTLTFAGEKEELSFASLKTIRP